MRAESRSPSRSPLVRAIALGTVLQLGAWLLVLAGTPVHVAAQAQAEFTPFVGVYIPTTDVFEERNVLAQGDKVTGKHKTTVIFGGRVGVWVTKRIAVEGTFGYAPSKGELTYTDPSNVRTSADTSAHVILANARVLVGFGPTGGNASWHFSLGCGIIAHGGDAYKDLDITGGKTDIGGIVGVGGRFKVGPSVAIRVDAEDNLFSAKFKDSTGAESDSKFQNDLVISTAVSISFGR